MTDRPLLGGFEIVPWSWLVVVAASLLGLWVALLLVLLVSGRRADARACVGFLPDCIVLVVRLLRDPRVPIRRKLWLAVLVAYLAWPFDVIPDFIPVVGQLDDIVVVTLVLRRVIRGGSEPVLRDLWPGPEASLRVLLRAIA
jgi:uncharacterized membrane protein YkvA (DUF1232 family)